MRLRMVLAACILASSSAGWSLWPTRTMPGRFLDPEGMAIDASGTIFVADEDRLTVFALRPDGTEIARIATDPSVPVPGGLISTGGSMVILAPGRMLGIRYDDLVELVVDGSSLRVVRVLGSKGTAPGQFLGLEGIARDAQGCIYTAEEDTHRVQVLSPDGAPLRSLPMVEEPEGITVDGDLVYVTFAKDDWVGAFDRRTGALVHRLGSGELDVPDAVLVRDGRVLVTDQGHDRIAVFGPDGALERTIGDRWGEGSLEKPEDIAIGPDGLLYVADGGNRRIAVFRLTGEYVRSIR